MKKLLLILIALLPFLAPAQTADPDTVHIPLPPHWNPLLQSLNRLLLKDDTLATAHLAINRWIVWELEDSLDEHKTQEALDDIKRPLLFTCGCKAQAHSKLPDQSWKITFLQHPQSNITDTVKALLTRPQRKDILVTLVPASWWQLLW